MRRGFAIAAAATALFVSASCGSSSNTVTAPQPARCGLEANPSSSAFPASGGSGTLRVVTNRECAWTAQSDAGWLTLASPAAGQGEGTVGFTIAGNADPSSRSGGIKVNDVRVAISQDGLPCDFRVSATRVSIDAAGGEQRSR